MEILIQFADSPYIYHGTDIGSDVVYLESVQTPRQIHTSTASLFDYQVALLRELTWPMGCDFPQDTLEQRLLLDKIEEWLNENAALQDSL